MLEPCRFAFCTILVAGLVAVAAPTGHALDAGRLGVTAPRKAATPTPRTPSDAGAASAGAVNHDAIAVIIGNRSYANGLPDVRFAENDARAVRRLVTGVLGFRDGNVIDLRNASQGEMLSVFGSAADYRGKLWSWVKPGVSDVFVYYSGHGVPGLRDKRGYLLPVDADPATPEINGYSLDLLLANLARLETRSVVVMLDACFSGNSEAGWLVKSASPVYVRTEVPQGPTGLSVITAAAGDQVASWDTEARLGLFTRHMLDALLDGRADIGRGGNGDGAVSLGELESYLDDEMTYAARRQYRRVQEASVLGDPRTILVPEVRRMTPPPVPVAAAPTQPEPEAGKYPPLGPTIADAQGFLSRHWSDVRAVINRYYEQEGSVWDQRGNPPQVEFAEEITKIDRRQVVAVRGNRFDVAIRYRWAGGGASELARATMRIAVEPDTLTVEKMWR